MPLDEFDTEILNGTREVMGEKFQSLVLAYIRNAQNYLMNIRKGSMAGNATMVRDAAHSLKSSSRYLGMVKVAREAEELEIYAHGTLDGDNDGSEFYVRYKILSRFYNNVEEVLQRYAMLG